MPSPFGSEQVSETKVEQGVDTVGALEVDVAAVPAVSAARTTARDMFFTPEGHTAIAAVSGHDPDSGPVYEHVIGDKKRDSSWESRKFEACLRLTAGVALSTFGHDVYEMAEPAASLKLHYSVDLGEQGVVPAEPDVQAGFKLGTPLSDEDGPPGDGLSAEPLDTQPLRLTVAAISRTAYPFFVRHEAPPAACRTTVGF